MPMGFKGFDDTCLAGVELFELAQSVSDGGYSYLIEVTRGLFAITRDERNSSALTQQAHCGLHTRWLECEFVCDCVNMAWHHGLLFPGGFNPGCLKC